MELYCCSSRPLSSVSYLIFIPKRVIHAQEEERKRVARELHDETGQALASLMVGLRNVEMALTPTEMQERLAELREVLASTLERVSRLA